MLFNSLEFLVFLPSVFLLYWVIPASRIKWQNLFLVGASYFFYAWWDWRFLSLILFSTLIDYAVALAMLKYSKRKKLLLWISMGCNLGLLGVFKYYNFFLDSFYDVIPGLKAVLGFNTLDIILPVGISFYTFQTMSYTIDVYRGNLKPTRDFVAFTAFVSFFPQLVAGPIERATNLLPQFLRKRNFDYQFAVEGLRQILWGLFKKVVIADNCAIFVNQFFEDPNAYNGSTLVLGAVFFAFQIYCDFSGYSDIAIGTGKLFGIQLMKNFHTPYFSRSVAEFWRRWHISLSTWFRDYVYIPLGGSRHGQWISMRNIAVIFLVSGLWHGANWTFIVWGGLNALFFLPVFLKKTNRRNLDIVAENTILPSWKEVFSILGTFILIDFAWIFFRAENIAHALDYLSGIFSWSLFQVPDFSGRTHALLTCILILLFLGIEWKGRRGNFAISASSLPDLRFLRWAFYLVVLYGIGLFMRTEESPFIYFQF